MRAILAALCLGLLAAPAAWAEAPGAHLRVVDVDDSLCVIVRTPEGRTMLFDAGDQGAIAPAPWPNSRRSGASICW